MVNVESMTQRGKTYNKYSVKTIIYDIESSGLEPFTDRILCISMMDTQTLQIKSFCQEDEQQLLKDFINEIQNVSKFVGYNSQSFDAPFILQRCLFYGIPLTRGFLSINNQIDLRKHALGFFLSYNKFQKGKLSQWAEKFGSPTQTSNGSKIPKLYLEKKWDEIKSHCEEDIVITKKLYDRCVQCNVL